MLVAQIDNGDLDKSSFLTIHLLTKQVTNYYANAFDNELMRTYNVLENCGQKLSEQHLEVIYCSICDVHTKPRFRVLYRHLLIILLKVT